MARVPGTSVDDCEIVPMTKDDVARVLGVSLSTVRRHVWPQLRVHGDGLVTNFEVRRFLDLNTWGPFGHLEAETHGRIYFVETVGAPFIKIGWTEAGVASRLLAMQTSSPFELRCVYDVLGTMGQERRIHRRLADLHVRGEWFRNEGRVAKFLRNKSPATLLGCRVSDFEEK